MRVVPEMIINVRARILMALIGVTVHLAVTADAWRIAAALSMPPHWHGQFLGMMIAMGIMAAICPFLPLGRVLIGMIALRSMLVLVAGLPFLGHSVSYGLIFANMVLESFVYFPPIVGVSYGLAMTGFSTWLACQRIPLWFGGAAPVEATALVVAWTQTGLCGVIGYWLAREFQLQAVNKATLNALRNSNNYLANTNMILQTIAANTGIIAVENEQSRIARELHDTIAHTLTNLFSIHDTYRKLLEVRGLTVPHEISQALALSRDGLAEVRSVVKGLRPQNSIEREGLGKVKRLVEVFAEATGIQVDLSYGDVPQFPGDLHEVTLYRAVQEGLTNAFRHGQATRISVVFHRLEDSIEVVVRDNGVGAARISGGFGLLGIYERAEEMGGSMGTESVPGCGFTLRVRLPLVED